MEANGYKNFFESNAGIVDSRQVDPPHLYGGESWDRYVLGSSVFRES